VNYGQWINLLGYQVTWLITVTGASHGKVWPAWLSATVLCFGCLATSSWRGLDMRLIALSALLGSILDGCLVTTGILQYSTPSPAVPCIETPLWIVALWIAFSTTLTRSLGWLRGRMGLTVIFGAVGGPLAYWAAARGWAVITFPAPAWRGLLVLAIGWAVALTVLVRAAKPTTITPGTQLPQRQESDPL
jgi:hypothetical protein